MMNRESSVSLFGARRARAARFALGFVTLVAGLSSVQHQSAAAAGVLALHGTVSSTSGKLLPGATVVAAGTRAIADGQGVYRLEVAATGRTLVEVWAPGYSERVLTLSTSGGGDFGLNFSGSVGLERANSNPSYGVKVSGLPARTKPGAKALHVHGTSATALYPKVIVELPNGSTRFYALHAAGSSFKSTIPLKTTGAYRVEILTTAALAAINTLVFDGVAPSYPTDPTFAPDPAGAKSERLATYTLGLINQVRALKGKPALGTQPKLTNAAVLHTADLVSHGYFLIHPHTGSDGSTPSQRVRRAGFKARTVTEDVGTATTAEMMMVVWLHSPFHLRNIMGKFRWAGVGVQKSGNAVYGTVDFAR